jgi:hypothetical protein
MTGTKRSSTVSKKSPVRKMTFLAHVSVNLLRVRHRRAVLEGWSEERKDGKRDSKKGKKKTKEGAKERRKDIKEGTQETRQGTARQARQGRVGRNVPQM